MKRYLFLLFLLFLLICMVGCIPSHIPSVISVNPSTGVRGQTLDVIISGTDFLGTEDVDFGYGNDIEVNYFEVISPTEIRANIYIHGYVHMGPKDIIVTNSYGTGKGEKLFTVAGVPIIRSLTPATGTQGSLMDVYIIGEGFYYGSTTFSFGSPDIGVEDYQQYGEYNTEAMIVTISITSTATPGTRNVTVTNPYGTATGTDMFTVTALEITGPVVSSVYPNIAIRGETFDVSIKGSNFTGTPTVRLGPGVNVTNVRLIDSNEIIVHIIVSLDAEFGYRDVSVTIGGVTGVGEGMFRVDPFI